MFPSDVFQQACHTAACLQCLPLEAPVGRVTEASREVSALPLKAIEPCRTVAKKGRPMKFIDECERSCHCKRKDAVRQVLRDRTAG